MRVPAISIAPDQAGKTPLDLDTPRIEPLRLVIAIGRVEPDHAAFPAEGLEGCFLIVDQRDHALPIARPIHLADQPEVAVEYASLDHRIARNFERIMLPRPKQGRGHCKTLG